MANRIATYGIKDLSDNKEYEVCNNYDREFNVTIANNLGMNKNVVENFSDYPMCDAKRKESCIHINNKSKIASACSVLHKKNEIISYRIKDPYFNRSEPSSYYKFRKNISFFKGGVESEYANEASFNHITNQVGGNVETAYWLYTLTKKTDWKGKLINVL